MRGYDKKKLVRDFAEIHDLTLEEAQMYMDTLVTLIVKGLTEVGRVPINYLGVFEKKYVKPKKIYNFQTKEINEIEGHGRVRFVPCDSLRKDLY